MEGKSGASSRGNSSSIAYIKVVAVKKLVVEFLARTAASAERRDAGDRAILAAKAVVHSAVPAASFTVKKLECLKQACRLNTLAWNNKIGLWCYFVGCVPR